MRLQQLHRPKSKNIVGRSRPPRIQTPPKVSPVAIESSARMAANSPAKVTCQGAAGGRSRSPTSLQDKDDQQKQCINSFHACMCVYTYVSYLYVYMSTHAQSAVYPRFVYGATSEFLMDKVYEGISSCLNMIIARITSLQAIYVHVQRYACKHSETKACMENSIVLVYYECTAATQYF